MTVTAAKTDHDSLPTRWSLLTRLKNWDDQDSWKEFFDTYWRLIYNVAIKAGLNEQEAQDVVQETVITVAKSLKDFKTDPARGSFRAWLLKTTHWRVINQFNKRQPDQLARAHRPPGDTRQTTTLERIPDAGVSDLEKIWDREWKEHIVELAMERLKRKVKPKHFQMFFLHAVRGQSVSDVAEALGVNVAQVYLVTHRLARRFKRQIELLKREIE